jgi:hypothetical protein
MPLCHLSGVANHQQAYAGQRISYLSLSNVAGGHHNIGEKGIRAWKLALGHGGGARGARYRV